MGAGQGIQLKDRFHLIIPEIEILCSGNQVSEFLLPFNHLYQACSGPGLRKVPVDTFQLSDSRKICITESCLYIGVLAHRCAAFAAANSRLTPLMTKHKLLLVVSTFARVFIVNR